MRKLITLILSAVILNSFVSAQTISGNIKDQQGKAVDKTTVSLLKAVDSTVVKFSVTDNAGAFNFNAGAGKYLVRASHIAYTPVYSKPIELTETSECISGRFKYG